MKKILLATSLLVPCIALAQLSSSPGIPASTLNKPNGPAQLDANGQGNALPVTAAGAVAVRSLSARLGDLPSIIDLGADPSGTADSTAAFNAASNTNHDYWVPPGRYTIAGCLQLDMMGLRGPAIYQRTNPGDVSLTAGAVLAFQPSTKACPAQIATTRGGISLEGLTFYWPEQDGSQAAVPTTVGAGGAANGSTVIPVANAGSIAVGASVTGNGVPAMARVTATTANSITLEVKTISALAAGTPLTTWSPVTYPPLLGNATNGQIVDLTFERNTVINAFDFLATTATVQGAGDWRITDNRIYTVRRTFNLQGSVHETTQVLNNMFTGGIYSKVSAGSAALLRWSGMNSEWLHVDTGASGSVDGMTMTGNLVHGYRYGERVVTGILNLFMGVLNLFDGVPTLLSVEGGSGYIGSQYGGTNVLGVFDPSGNGQVLPQFQFPGIVFAQTGPVRASFTDVGMGYTGGDMIDVLGSGPSVVSIRGGVLENYGLGGAADAWGVLCTNPSADLTVSTSFKGSGTGNQDGVGLSACGQAAVVANVFEGLKTPVLAYAGQQAVITGNTSRGSTGGASFLQFPANFATLKSSGNLWDQTGPSHVGWPAASARVAATQLISGSNKTQLLFGSTSFDDTSAIAGSTFTAALAGYYHVSARVAQNGGGTAGDLWTLSIDQAGSRNLSFARDYVMPGSAGAVDLTELVYLAAGDTMQVNLTRAAGSGTWTVPADGSRSRFAVEMVQ